MCNDDGSSEQTEVQKMPEVPYLTPEQEAEMDKVRDYIWAGCITDNYPARTAHAAHAKLVAYLHHARL